VIDVELIENFGGGARSRNDAEQEVRRLPGAFLAFDQCPGGLGQDIASVVRHRDPAGDRFCASSYRYNGFSGRFKGDAKRNERRPRLSAGFRW
jgi:hypothetical protein